MRSSLSIVMLLAGYLSCLDAGATLVTSENFDYGTSDVVGNTAVIPFGGQPWQAVNTEVRYKESDVADNNASWAGTGYVLGSENDDTGSLRMSGSTTRGTQRPLNAELTGEIWVSSLIRVESMTANGHALALALNNTAGFVNNGAGGFGIGVAYSNGVFHSAITAANGTASVYGTDSWTAGTTSADFYLVLGQFTHNPAGNDTINLWTFANNASVPTTVAGLGTPTVTGTGNYWSAGSLTNAYVITRNTTGNLDAIRVSDASGDAGLIDVLGVIPEPGTLSLLGLAALLVSRRLKGILG